MKEIIQHILPQACLITVLILAIIGAIYLALRFIWWPMEQRREWKEAAERANPPKPYVRTTQWVEPKIINPVSKEHQAQMIRLAEFMKLDAIKYDLTDDGDRYELTSGGEMVVLHISGGHLRIEWE